MNNTKPSRKRYKSKRVFVRRNLDLELEILARKLGNATVFYLKP